MLKQIILFCFFYIWTNESFGQLRLGLSPATAVPIGNYRISTKNGFGAILSGKYALNDRWLLTSNFNYLAFGKAAKDDDLPGLLVNLGISINTAVLLSSINDSLPNPLKIPNVNYLVSEFGFEYNILVNKIKPYIGLSAGLYVQKSGELGLRLYDFIVTANESLPPNQQIPNATLQNFVPLLGSSTLPINGSTINFGLAPVAGCSYELSEKWGLDLNIKCAFIPVPERDGGAVVLTLGLGAFYKL